MLARDTKAQLGNSHALLSDRVIFVRTAIIVGDYYSALVKGSIMTLHPGATLTSTVDQLLSRLLGHARADRLLRVLVVPAALLEERGELVSRAALAEVLNIVLLDDLLDRVPAAKRYFERSAVTGRPFFQDHGAVRTVALVDMGTLPAGQESIVRILRPLGYALNGTYPLDRLKMTGRSYAQADFPEGIAQFFISELHPERFSPQFQESVKRVTASSADPLSKSALELLEKLDKQKNLSIEEAATLLPLLTVCFSRHHGEVSEADYETLLAESAEMAWISTEGNVFNHVTDRVDDVEALSAELKTLGEPIKDSVEHSQSNRVQQTAFRAAQVDRSFRAANGTTVTRAVPGSFLEFITRLSIPEEGKLDLSFDSSNAQAIFKMTAGAGAR